MPAYDRPATDFINPTQDLLINAKARLTNGYENPLKDPTLQPPLKVREVKISNRLDPLELSRQITEAPEAFIIFENSSYQNRPLRSAFISVYLFFNIEGDPTNSTIKGRQALDQVVNLLDNYMDMCAHWRIQDDLAVTITGLEYVTYQVRFRVEDH